MNIKKTIHSFASGAIGLSLLVAFTGCGLATAVAAAPPLSTTNPVQYKFFKDWDQIYSINVHLVEVNLEHPNVEIGLALAKGKTNSREKVTDIARRHKALAAINGSFFQYGTKAIPSAVGLLMKDGKIIADSRHRRTSLGITEDKKVIVGIPDITTGLYFPDIDRFRSVSGINQNRQKRQTIVYNPYFGKYTQTNTWGREVVVRKNEVIRYSYGNTQIPEDGFVISVHGAQKNVSDLYPIGTQVELKAHKKGEWRNVETIITGAPQLVHEGRIHNTYFEERLQPSLKRPNARTAVGITHNRKLLLVSAFPGKGKGGVTFTRLAHIMKRLGAVEAMGLDGGGSTSIYVSNKGIKHATRAVTNALIVKLRESEPAN